MSQQEIDKAVANATGKKLGTVRSRSFSIADPFEVAFDPESRGPMVLDWDSMYPREWADCCSLKAGVLVRLLFFSYGGPRKYSMIVLATIWYS
jgi:hypothetical protein